MSDLHHKIQRVNGVKLISDTRRCAINGANYTRDQLGLQRLEIKVRTCLACRQPFESTGARLCGCNADDVLGLRIGECG